MKRFILAVLMMFCINITFAESGITTRELKGFDDLTESQKADIVKQVANASKSGTPALEDPERLEKWVNFGTSIGKGIGGVAKEIGVATNEFVNTPVGKLAVGLIVWKIMGNQLVHICGAGIFFVVWLSLWIYLIRRMAVIQSVVYTAVANSFWRSKTITYCDAKSSDIAEIRLWFMFLFIVCTMITIVMGFSY